MDFKLMTFKGDDGQEYQGIVFRDTTLFNDADVQEKIDTAINETKKICEENHFIAQVVGSGTEALTFTCPFEPQLLHITGFSPAGYTNVNCIAYFIADFKSLSYLAARSGVYTSNNLASSAMTATTVLTRYARAEDGTITINNVTGNTKDTKGIFGSNMVYQIVACRYTDKTDKELVTEYVESLTGTGTATFSADKINAVFTEEEWEALNSSTSWNLERA